MKTRLYFLDNLRSFLILLVVMIHAGLVYTPGLEHAWSVKDVTGSNDLIGLLGLYIDIFVMFTMFFIAGYFVPGSLQQKGAVKFTLSKVKRILLPWAIAVLTLIPMYKYIFLYSRGLPQEEWYSYFHFFERANENLAFFANKPSQVWLWFLPALFIFQMLYLGLNKLKLTSFKLSPGLAVALFIVLGVASSKLMKVYGLEGWFHSYFLDFQKERALLYFMSFLLGSMAYKQNWFAQKRQKLGIRIAIYTIFNLALLMYTIIVINYYNNMATPGEYKHVFNAFWDSYLYHISLVLSMLGCLYSCIHIFQHSFNKANRYQRELNKDSYGIYIIHMIVLSVFALGLKEISAPGLVKYLVLTASSFIISQLIIYTYRNLKNQMTMKTMKNLSFIAIILFFSACANQNSQAKENKPLGDTKAPEMSIHEAAFYGNVDMLKQHIEAGTDLNQKNQDGSSPLNIAATFNKVEAAKLLIEAGADLNVKNNEGSTPLHVAAFFCHTEIVKALLKAGADKNRKNYSGATPYMSVAAPFDQVKPIYQYVEQSLAPFGVKFDYEYLEMERPKIAELIK